LLWEHNAGRPEGAWRVWLSDLSSGMLVEARRRIKASRIQGYVSLDAQTLPFPDERFDAAIANHMLYHVPEIGDCLRELRRILRPGGRLYAATNGPRHLQEIARLVSIAKSEARSETVQAFRGSVARFDLDTGLQQVASLFSHVEVRRYPDSLRVTDIEAVVRYVQSSSILAVTGLALERLRQLLADEIRSHGYLAVSKEVGLIMGSRKDGA
jgi:SAM-dependent methyltransferase